ncbi:MAG: LytTR family DNA-binding domain-containing protein [Oscillospiraceae bacterium]|nr:LytTR family DNA-binding domain-containing protein [Oscillospiraceae bacterium]
MIHVVICEDNFAQRKRIETIVNNHIMMEEYDMEIALSADDPTAVLHYSHMHPEQKVFYILDVDLGHEIDGLALAARIRERDLYSAFIFVTTHADLLHLTFQYKLEAMDYIVKDRPLELQGRIQTCIDTIYQRYSSDKSPKTGRYQVKDGDRTRLIPFDDIMFFTSHPTPHKVVLHLENSQIIFYGSINELTEISPDFYRSHKSFVVNLKNIKQVDHAMKEIEMTNGEIALVGSKKVQELLNAIAENG